MHKSTEMIIPKTAIVQQIRDLVSASTPKMIGPLVVILPCGRSGNFLRNTLKGKQVSGQLLHFDKDNSSFNHRFFSLHLLPIPDKPGSQLASLYDLQIIWVRTKP